MNKGHSILPSGSFPEVDTSVFSGTQHSIRGPSGVVCDKAGFFEEKICLNPKWGKLSKNRVF